MNPNIQGNKWLIAASVSLGAIMATIDTFVLFVATPHLRAIFSATFSEISWVSISYSAATIIVMPLSGWLCQLYGIKRVYQAGLVIFIVSSILCGFALSLEALVIFRIFQGIGAGILLPVEQLILRRSFPPDEHRIAMAIYGMTIMVGPAVGPLLGGIIIDNYHWSLIFFVNVPIGILGFILAKRFVPNLLSDAGGKSLKPDWIGIVLLVLTIFPLVWLLERGDRLYWFEETSNVFLLFLSMSSLLMFCAHELMIKNPAVDLRVMRDKVFSSALFLSFILGFVVSATLFILPIYMQEVLDFTATKAGTALIPRAILMMFMFPFVGFLLGRVNPKLLMSMGMILGIVSAFMMSKFTHETGWHDIILPQLIQGAAVALVLTPLAAVALKQVSIKNLAAASGLDSLSRQLGSVVGISVFATLLNYFELYSRGNVLHRINLHYSVLYERFGGVIQTFMANNVVDGTTARKQAFMALNGRVQEQVLVLTYMKLFHWIAILFFMMLLVTLFIRLGRNN